MKLVNHCFAIAFMTTGLALLLVNTYGLLTEIRKDDLGLENQEDLRIPNDIPLSYQESIDKLESISTDDKQLTAYRLNEIVEQSLSHVEWNKVDPVAYRQLVPIWENYFLYFIGKFSGIPEFYRYHFVDYKRSIKRGIGICGDASMVLSQVLDLAEIDNHIVSYKGHVIAEAQLEDNTSILLDPDFGVVLDFSLEALKKNPAKAFSYYLDAGFSEKDALMMVRVYSRPYTIFDDVYAFMPKRYILEYVSYALRWPLPFLLLLAGWKLQSINNKNNKDLSSRYH